MIKINIDENTFSELQNIHWEWFKQYKKQAELVRKDYIDNDDPLSKLITFILNDINTELLVIGNSKSYENNICELNTLLTEVLTNYPSIFSNKIKASIKSYLSKIRHNLRACSSSDVRSIDKYKNQITAFLVRNYHILCEYIGKRQFNYTYTKLKPLVTI
jgi:hypothetical protein